MTIPSPIWNIPDGFATLLGALATLLAGAFVIVAAIVAWRSVQQQIQAADQLERARAASEASTLQAGFTAEMLVFSTAVIEAASLWNQRGRNEPNRTVTTGWPLFRDPLFYRARYPQMMVPACRSHSFAPLGRHKLRAPMGGKGH